MKILKDKDKNIKSNMALQKSDVHNFNFKQKHLRKKTIDKHGVYKKKSSMFSFLFLILNVVVVAAVLYFQLKNENISSLSSLLTSNFNLWFFAVIILLYLFILFLESVRINMLIKNATGKSRIFFSYKLFTLGKYYDLLTPLATGGQPFQMYYLSKHKFKMHNAFSVPLSKYILMQISWVLISIFAVSVAITSDIINFDSAVLIVAVASFALNLLLVSFVLIASINRRFGNFITNKVIKFLSKIRIIKDFEKAKENTQKVFSDYQKSIKSIFTNKKLFIKLLIVSISIFVVIFCLPFFIYSTLITYDPSLFFDIFIKTNIIEIASGVIPIPGGTGVSEISFTALFTTYFTSGTFFWALIMFRFFNMYSYLLQGITITIIDYFQKINLLKKQKKLIK